MTHISYKLLNCNLISILGYLNHEIVDNLYAIDSFPWDAQKPSNMGGFVNLPPRNLYAINNVTISKRAHRNKRERKRDWCVHGKWTLVAVGFIFRSQASAKCTWISTTSPKHLNVSCTQTQNTCPLVCDADSIGYNCIIALRRTCTYYINIYKYINVYCNSKAAKSVRYRNSVTIYYIQVPSSSIHWDFSPSPRAYKRLWSSKLNVNGICTTARCSASQTHRGDETKKQIKKRSVHCYGDHLSRHEWPQVPVTVRTRHSRPSTLYAPAIYCSGIHIYIDNLCR